MEGTVIYTVTYDALQQEQGVMVYEKDILSISF